MSATEQEIAALAGLLRASRRAVVFTGAGISTESGIPDFRSPSGIWTRMAPIEFQDFVTSAKMRREAWRRRFAMEEMFASVAPNEGHRAVAALVARGTASSIITQNIDNLHQDAGVPPEKVIEIHGNTRYAKCLDCGARVELAPIRAHFEAHGEAPDCLDCGGLLKTATISFGQAMPEQEMARAEAEALACDLFLVLGSSLVVYPAAGFPALARRNGARLAIITTGTPRTRTAVPTWCSTARSGLSFPPPLTRYKERWTPHWRWLVWPPDSHRIARSLPCPASTKKKSPNPTSPSPRPRRSRRRCSSLAPC